MLYPYTTLFRSLIQVDGNKDGLANAADSILELQNTIIDGGTNGLTQPAVFTIDGQLNVTASANNTIENFNTGTAGTSTVTFTNDDNLRLTSTRVSIPH